MEKTVNTIRRRCVMCVEREYSRQVQALCEKCFPELQFGIREAGEKNDYVDLFECKSEPGTLAELEEGEAKYREVSAFTSGIREGWHLHQSVTPRWL